MIDKKKCSVCGEDKLFDEFYKQKEEDLEEDEFEEEDYDEDKEDH